PPPCPPSFPYTTLFRSLDSVPDYLADFVADDAINAGTLFEADLLEIEAAQPELIIVAGRSATLYDDLREIAPTVNLSSEGSFERSEEHTSELQSRFDLV